MSDLKNQVKQKPQIEEIASDYLDGDALSNLLDFVVWMRASRMTPTFAKATPHKAKSREV